MPVREIRGRCCTSLQDGWQVPRADILAAAVPVTYRSTVAEY
jgi:hypothetical protein